MIIDNLELRTALDYLRLFKAHNQAESADDKRRDDGTSVVFEPRGDRLLAQVKGQQSNGSYQLSPRTDVADAFAMSLERIHALSKELGEEEAIEIRPGERMHFLDFSEALTRQIYLAAHEPKRINQADKPNVAPLVVSSAKLNAMVRGVKHAAGKDRGGKWEFDSVLIEYRKDAFHVVATNGHRMAYRTTDQIKEDEETYEDTEDDDLELVRHHRFVIPRFSFEQLLGVLEPGTEACLWASKNQLWISAGPRHAVLPRIESRYPDYRRMLLGDLWKQAAKITVDRLELLSAFKAICAMTDSEDRGIYLYVMDRKVTLALEESTVEVDCRVSGFTDRQYAINARYMRDALNAIEADSVKLLLPNEYESPIAIRIENHLEIMAQMSQPEPEEDEDEE